MAKTKSARKNARQAERRAAVNRARESRVKTYLKKVEAAIASGNKQSAQDAFKAAQPVLMRGVGQKVVHKNLVARKLSRLSARIKAL
ncbi:MAG TPA: 30S ribosomal protein S20 [Alphaproteobacteria bacterium]|nr:30S ribosomal protein S20 [Alphaproteobacteria bacterium]